MGKYDFAEPPWVYSPTEVMNWINATHPSTRVKNHMLLKAKKKNT